jgi:uncharacterized membrane protein
VSVQRRAYVDWLRGVAVLCMIEWHVLDAWTAPDARAPGPWLVIKIIGGFAAPLFLMLAGIAVPLAAQAREARGASPDEASRALQKRGWEIFGIAHLFRLQSFLLNPSGRWSAILKPDILNIMGLGLVGTAWLCGRAARRARGVWWLLLPAVAVIALTPWSPAWWWPTLLPPRLEAYIRPVVQNGASMGVFSLFPWVAFVPAGAWLGLLLVKCRGEADERRIHLRFALAGAAAAVVGYVAGALPAPIGQESSVLAPFWMVLSKGGVMTGVLGASWFWARKLALPGANWLLLFGKTSLFVYWVHVELAYGFLSYPLHQALPLGWSLVGLALMTLAMYGAATLWVRRAKGQPLIPAHMRAN